MMNAKRRIMDANTTARTLSADTDANVGSDMN